MTLENSSQDFKIKKDFIDMQQELKKFLEETDVFTLSDILRDPLVVHSVEDYVAAYGELDNLKRVRKVLKKLQKVKKKHVDLHNIIEGIDAFPPKATESQRIYFSDSGLKRSLFTLSSAKSDKELTKDRMVQIFKNHMKIIDSITGFTIPKPVFSRNFSVSSSHSHLMKKIEKTGDFSQGVHQKGGSEITSTASFRNGILRSTAPTDRSSKAQASPKSSNARPKTGNCSVTKTKELPHQCLINQNPHEALSSSIKFPEQQLHNKHPKNKNKSDQNS